MMLELRKPSIFDRLQSADLSLLAKKLQEKEIPEQPIFQEDAEILVMHTMERHHRDAESAFAHTLPVGQPTPAGVNPGA